MTYSAWSCRELDSTDPTADVSIYQTNGLCFTFCKDDYAYAITQETSCWCSNYTPDDSTQVNLNRCDIDCPAYPVEKCGGRGLFGYVELNGHLPSGTQGGEQTSSTSTVSTIMRVVSFFHCHLAIHDLFQSSRCAT